MASRIAGITIEIGGDTTKLTSALKGVDSQLKTTQSTLKDVDKLLKFDPKNTELLTQKQKALESAIENTKERLEKLKEAQKDVGEGTAEWDALQREIIETEHNLDNLEDEYKDFGSVAKQQIKAVGSHIKEAGKKVSAFGDAWTKKVTLPIAALGGAAYKAFVDVDEGMDIIIKKTGATGDSLDELGKIMEDIAAEIPTDFETAGEAVGEVATRFDLTGEELKDLSTKFIKFAKLNDTDVSTSIDNVQKAMAAFNVDTRYAGNVLDLLNTASQQTGVPVDKLANSLVSNSTALREMGFSLNSSVAFLSKLDKAGIDASTVMTGLKKALQNATKDGKSMDEAVKDLQSSIVNAKTDTEAMQIATELFGAKAGPAIAQAVREGRMSFEDFALASEEYMGNVEDTFEATLDPADKFNVALNNLKLLGADIAETVMPLLTQALEWLREKIQIVKEWWDGLDDSQKETILTIGGIVAAVGPVLAVVGRITSGIGGLISLLTGPAGIAVAIAGVIAAGVYLVQHWDEVKEKAKEIWEKIVKFFTQAWEDIKNIDWVQLGKDVWDWLLGAFTDVNKWIDARFNEAWEAISAIDWKQLGENIWNWLLKAFTDVNKWLDERFNEAWEAISAIDWKKLGEDFWNWIVEAFLDVGGWFEERFKEAKDLIGKVDWKQLGKDMWKNTTKAFSDVGGWFEKQFNTAWNDIEKIDWVKLGDDMWAWIVQAFANVGGWFYDQFKAAWDNILDIDWADIGSTIWTAIETALTGIGDWLLSVFKEPINAVIDLLNTMIGKVEGAVNAVIRGINNHLKVDVTLWNPFGKDYHIKWEPGLNEVEFGKIRKLANGGVLPEGGRAIVGEYAPEYLSVQNGQAVVTPIPGAERFGGSTYNNTINVYQQPGEDANALAHRVMRIMTREQTQRNVAYA